MVGKAERHIDADDQGLVGDWVEIGAKLRVPAETLGSGNGPSARAGLDFRF
jgi:hypothetical protein